MDIVSISEAKSKVNLNKTKVTLCIGDSITLKLKNSKNKPDWSSNKKSVVTVSSSGKVTAKKAGAAKITAKVGKNKYICKITVPKQYISKASLTLDVGENKEISIYGVSDNDNIVWKSNDKKIATITDDGIITGIGEGKTTISGTVNNGKGKTYECNVVVISTQKPVQTPSPTQNPIPTIKPTKTPIVTQEPVPTQTPSNGYSADIVKGARGLGVLHYLLRYPDSLIINKIGTIRDNSGYTHTFINYSAKNYYGNYVEKALLCMEKENGDDKGAGGEFYICTEGSKWYAFIRNKNIWRDDRIVSILNISDVIDCANSYAGEEIHYWLPKFKDMFWTEDDMYFCEVIF